MCTEERPCEDTAPRTEASGETNPTNTLISDLEICVKINPYCLSHPVCGIFKAALANLCIAVVKFHQNMVKRLFTQDVLRAR